MGGFRGDDFPAPPNAALPDVAVSAAEPQLSRLHPLIVGFLDQFASRRKWLLVARGTAVAILTLLLAATLIIGVDYFFLLSDPSRWILSVMAYLAALYGGLRGGWWRAATPSSEMLAQEAQSASPMLRDDLLSAVELSQNENQNDSYRFREATQERIATRVASLSADELLPWELIRNWLIAAVLVLVTVVLLMGVPPMQWGRRLARAMLPGVAIQRAAITQLEITAPSPPTRYVAEGDAISIVATVAKLGDSDVTLQWIDDDGREGIQELVARGSEAETTGDGRQRDPSSVRRFAGNVTVGSVPVRYRVAAGDAVSLWHVLTPQPRPAVKQITKRYVYPDYTKLEPFTETDTHGDLSAVIGTFADVTVEFDQPVRDAVLRYGLRGRPEAMEPADEVGLVYTARVPIQTPTSFQADAVSIRSELNQPFGPQYSITPIADSPPMALWGRVPDAAIINPLQTVELTAIGEDDLPMDRMVQEIQINNDPVIRRIIDVQGDQRKIEARWLWDLLDCDGDGEPDSRKLESGDTVRSRVVAIDRRGNRGESEFFELLIADEGIDEDQHLRLQLATEIVRKLTERWREQSAMLKFAEDTMGDEDAVPDDAWFEQMEKWISGIPEMSSQLKTTISVATSQYDGVVWASLADWNQVRDLATIRLYESFVRRRNVIADATMAPNDDRDQRRSLVNEAREIRNSIDDLETVAIGLLGTEMSAARVGDAMILRRSLGPVIDRGNPLPIERFPRYVKLASTRLLELSELGSAGRDLMPRSAISQMENFAKWAQNWHARLNNEVSELSPQRHQQLRNTMLQFESDLRNQVAHSLLDNNLIARMNSAAEKIDRKNPSMGDRVEEAREAAQRQRSDEERADRTKDLDQVAKYRRSAEEASRRFENERSDLLAVLDARESRQRKLVNADLRFAADLNLVRAAIENVTRNGFSDYKEESASDVWQKIENASGILDAAGSLESARRVLVECGNLERSLEYGAQAKVRQPNRVEHYIVAARLPIERMKKLGVDWEILSGIDAARYNDDASRARTQITARRWMASPEKGKAMVRGDGAILAMLDLHRENKPKLDPVIEEARETILQYVETLSEQARRAAKAADEAKQANEPKDSEDDEPDGKEKDADEQKDAGQKESVQDSAEQKLADAQKEAAEMIQSLIDRANNADIWSEAPQREEDLEVARDADAASALIDEARKEVDEAIKQARAEEELGAVAAGKEQIAQSLENLREELKQVAEHFEKLENEQDAGASREQLREEAAASQAERDLEPLRQDLEQAAEEMSVDPEERLKQLEAEIKRDSAMQDELSKIAQQAIDAASDQMDQAAEDENEVRRQLETADPLLQEAKRRLRAELQAMSRMAADVDAALLNRSNQAVNAAEKMESTEDAIEDAKDTLQETRDKIAKAIADANSLRGDDELVENLKQASAKMAEALRDAAKATQRLQEKSNEVVEKSSDREFANDAQRKQAEQKTAAQTRQMQQVARQSLTDRGRAANSDRDRWREVSRDAFRRERDTKRAMQDAERQIKQLEKRRDSAADRENRSEVAKLEQQISDEQQKAKRLDTAAKASKKTGELANDRAEQAAKRQKEVQSSALPPLDTANPPAELASRFAQQAGKELQALAERAEAISQRIPESVNPSITDDQASNLSKKQNQITDDISFAAADLARASRHERRMDRQASADQLANAANEVMENAQPAAAKAGEMLQGESSQELGDEPDSGKTGDSKSGVDMGKQSADQTKAAEKAIRQTADKLSGRVAAVAEEQPPEKRASEAAEGSESSDARSGDADPSRSAESAGPQTQGGTPQESQEKAQQLDELDRALNAPSPGSDSPPQGDASKDSAQDASKDPSQGKPSEAGKDSPVGDQGTPEPSPSAGQLSPTMAAAMQRKMQAAARQRQQMLDPAQDSTGEGKADEQAPDAPPSTSDSSNMSGTGDPPGGGDVDPLRDRLGDDWGSLRERTTDDASQADQQRVPPAFRKQLEAYFREIARRGKKASKE